MWYTIKQNFKSLFSVNFSKNAYLFQSSSPFLVTFSAPIERITYQYDSDGRRIPLIPITVNRKKLKQSMFDMDDQFTIRDTQEIDLNEYFIIKTTKVLVNKLLIQHTDEGQKLILQEAFVSVAEAGTVYQELAPTRYTVVAHPNSISYRSFTITSVERDGWLLSLKATTKRIVGVMENEMKSENLVLEEEVMIKIYPHRNTFINALVFRAISNEYKKIKKFIGC